MKKTTTSNQHLSIFFLSCLCQEINILYIRSPHNDRKEGGGGNIHARGLLLTHIRDVFVCVS